MDLLKTATDWARAEIFSSSFFILFGVLFLMASVGFWYLGKTEISKSYVLPTLVAGTLLLIIGIGLVSGNVMRLKKFESTYSADAQAFVNSEIARTDKTITEYRTVVFKAIPILIILCALLIVFFEAPIWRASSITALAMLTVILLVDGTAKDRITNYKEKLVSNGASD